MATDYCKYHPLTTAKWHCATCCIKVCDDCAPAGTDMESLPNCILCNQPLQPVKTGMSVQPFWQRYTDFLRLPFFLPGLAILLLLLLLPGLAPENLLLPVGAGSFFMLGLTGWALLQKCAKGEVLFPGTEGVTSALSGPGLQVALLIAVIMSGLLWAGAFAPMLSVLAAVVVAMLMPAAFMIVALEKTLKGLGRPASWQHVFAAVRFLYVPLAGSALILFLLSQAVVSLLADVAAPGVLQGLRHVFYGYGLWVVFGVSGYCLLQFQGELGFQGEGVRSRVRRSAVRRLDSNTAKLEVYLKEGMYEKAESLLKGLADKQRNAVDAQERYFQFLVFLRDKQGVAMQGESYMAALLSAKQAREALIVFSKILLVMPEYRPEEAEVTFDLAKACVELQEYARAAALLDGLHQTAPHFPQLPEAYMLRAKLLHEKLGQSAQALEVMDYLVNRFSKHPRFETMRSYWKQLGGKDVSQDYLT